MSPDCQCLCSQCTAFHQQTCWSLTRGYNTTHQNNAAASYTCRPMCSQRSFRQYSVQPLRSRYHLPCYNYAAGSQTVNKQSCSLSPKHEVQLETASCRLRRRARCTRSDPVKRNTTKLATRCRSISFSSSVTMSAILHGAARL
jgi:hypothetical protein